MPLHRGEGVGMDQGQMNMDLQKFLNKQDITLDILENGIWQIIRKLEISLENIIP